MGLPEQGPILAARRVHLAVGMPKQGLLLLLFFATAASDDARAPARATTACERRVLSAQKPSSLAAPELAALETTAVASMRRADPKTLEVFGHLPHSGGSAWSWRLASAFRASEIAPGSGFSKGYNVQNPDPWVAEARGCGRARQRRDPLAAASSADAAAAAGAPWRVLYSHDGVGCAGRNGTLAAAVGGAPWRQATMLRGPLDAALQARAPWFGAAAATLAANATAAAARRLARFAARLRYLSSGWPTRGSDAPPGRERRPAAAWAPLDRQTRWVLGGGGGAAHSFACAAVAEPPSVVRAAEALAAMPWFGLQHRWLESACLWHATSRVPWPRESSAACPSPMRCEAPAKREDDRRRLKAFGKAPAAGCRPEVCPADAALSRTSVTKDNVLLGGSTSCLLRELCLAAGDDFFDALVAPLAAPSPDDDLLAAAEAMFDARVAAAAAAAREPPVRDLLHPSCFRRPPPRGFGA